MRYTISILQQTQETDAFGQTLDVWTPVYSGLFASREPLLGNEFHTANATQSKVETKFRTYYVPGVENKMRVSDSENVYEILSAVNVKSLGRELLLYCKRV